jgi:hypothetical protein
MERQSTPPWSVPPTHPERGNTWYSPEHRGLRPQSPALGAGTRHKAQGIRPKHRGGLNDGVCFGVRKRIAATLQTPTSDMRLETEAWQGEGLHPVSPGPIHHLGSRRRRADRPEGLSLHRQPGRWRLLGEAGNCTGNTKMPPAERGRIEGSELAAEPILYGAPSRGRGGTLQRLPYIETINWTPICATQIEGG